MSYTNGLDKPSDYFNTVLWTGDGTSSNSITGVGFQPDWNWIKRRSSVASHHLQDIIRGSTVSVYSNLTNAEGTDVNNVTSFDSDGFTLGNGSGVNTSGVTYVGWNWLASNTTASNTDGSITSTVSANTTSGFSIVTYTGNGSSGATVGHGLGVAPKMTIIKQRNSANGWNVWAYANNNGDPDSFGELNSTSAWYQNQGASGTYTTTPDSSVLTLTNYGQVNGSGNTYVAYCWSEVKSFSKFGIYTGNGSADGTFVYTGFKPAFVLIKVTSTTNDWEIHDNKRGSSNVINAILQPNLSDAESTSGREIDFLSNGFKLRNSGSQNNLSGGTFIYMAFASNPFVTSTGIPTTAR